MNIVSVLIFAAAVGLVACGPTTPKATATTKACKPCPTSVSLVCAVSKLDFFMTFPNLCYMQLANTLDSSYAFQVSHNGTCKTPVGTIPTVPLGCPGSNVTVNSLLPANSSFSAMLNQLPMAKNLTSAQTSMLSSMATGFNLGSFSMFG